MTNQPRVPASPAPSSSDSFFNSIRRLGIERTPDRWVGGVAAGVAHRLGWDPLIVRGLLIIGFFLGGLGLIAYGVGWALLPESEDGRIHLQEAIHGRFNPALIGAGLVTFSGMISDGPFGGGGPFGFISRFSGFGNFELFHWISGLFTGLFWTVALVLFIRWLKDKRRYHKYLKNREVNPASAENSVNVETVVFDDADNNSVADTSIDNIGADYIVMENGIIASAVVEESADETIILETIDTTSDNTVVENIAIDDAVPNNTYAEKAAARAEAARVKAESRAKTYEEKAYYRQQRDIEKHTDG